MKVVVIIPARMAASRFPGKPMKNILGIPMIGHCYKRAEIAFGSNAVYVATCDQEIANYVKKISGNVVMTAQHHQRATTRTAEALEIIEGEIGKEIEIVIMLQGDEPLVSPPSIKKIIEIFKDQEVQVCNLMTKLKTIESSLDKNNVKVVFDKNNNALYFSREPIPSPWKGAEDINMYMQTGIIGFRRNSLISFNKLDEGILEKIESIDMNRLLEVGKKIRMVEVKEVMIGVDTSDELKEVELIMQSDPYMPDYQNLMKIN
jgi:3-deoxy-manno-octulosonate cytidylyltransferase (CMP-KDO synthetase)